MSVDSSRGCSTFGTRFLCAKYDQTAGRGFKIRFFVRVVSMVKINLKSDKVNSICIIKYAYKLQNYD